MRNFAPRNWLKIAVLIIAITSVLLNVSLVTYELGGNDSPEIVQIPTVPLIKADVSKNSTPTPTPTAIPTATPTPTLTPTAVPEPTIEPTPEPTPTPIVEDGYLSVTEYEKKMILKIAQAEAGNQGVKGKALVMNVVFRRRYLKQFPNSIEGVSFEPAQFSPINDGNYAKAVPDEECYEALDMVLNGWDESQGSTYFRTIVDYPTWHSEHLQHLFDFGSHAFYKEYDE